jgi:PAS domain S-box-containing protein
LKQTTQGPLQFALNLIPAHVWYASGTGALAFVNERCADYLGLAKGDPLRFGGQSEAAWDSHLAFLHPDDGNETRRVWSDCLAERVAGEVTFRVRNADGGYRWFLSRAEPLHGPEGGLEGWIGINLEIEDRKQAEFYLAEGQRLGRSGSWAFSAGGFTYWSVQLFEIHGLQPRMKPPDVTEYLALVYAEDRDRVAEEFKRLQAGPATLDHMARIVRPDGAIRYVRCVGGPAPNGHGLVGTGIDVTEQEELTQALRKNEATLRLLVDGIAAFVTAHTADGELEFANQKVLDYFGATLEELKHWPTSDAIHPDDLSAVVDDWAHSLQTGQPYERVNRYRCSDGAYRWFRARGLPSRDSQGQLLRWYVVLSDVDESQRAKEKLEKREKELRQVLDLAPQLMAVFGPARERLYANSGSLAYLGITLEEWRKQSLELEVHPEDVERVRVAAARGVSSRSGYELEMRIRKGDGTYRWFLARYNTLEVDEGSRWYVACTDIEDRKRAEERLRQENVALREEIEKTSMFEQIVGASPALSAVLSRAVKVAGSESTVLISGETGTGKELVARAIHRRSPRAAGSFVTVNCAAIPRELVASELFGHEKGAFTGASQQRVGRFELADGGTIFLDEVGELLPDVQIALLRILQEREFERLGGRDTIHVDVRVIAATNRDLEEAVADGTFRQDLFYRLNVFPVQMPPLRDRGDDIALLVEYFVDRYGRKMGKTFRRINKATLDRLKSYAWPGNVRELQNVIERSAIVCDSEEFTIDDSWLTSGAASNSRILLHSTLAVHERALIEEALRASRGRVSGPAGAAARVGVPRSTLESKIRALGIDKLRFRR